MKKAQLCYLVLCWCFPLSLFAQPTILDASYKSLETEPIELIQWSQFTNQFLLDVKTWPKSDGKVVLESASKQVSFGTFAIEVIVSSSYKNANLAIEVPVIFTSYQLYANSKLIGSLGKIGPNVQACLPQTRPAVYFFKTNKDTIQILLEAASFYPSTGGIHSSVRLGLAESILQKNESIKIMDYVLFIILLIIALVSVCFYYIRFEHRSVFLFQFLFGSAWLVRSLFAYYYRILDWLDLSWETQMRIEYLSMIFSTILGLLFIASLFPQDFKKIAKMLALTICTAFSISVLYLPPAIFISYASIYLGFSCLVLTYVLFVIMRAFLDNRGGSTIMLITIFIGCLTFGYVIISYLGFLEMNMIVYNVGFVILWIMLVSSVSVRLSKIDRLSESNVLTMEHFFPNTPK